MPALGPRGFGDWQRTTPWDSPVQQEVTHKAFKESLFSEVLDVSRFGYVIMSAQAEEVGELVAAETFQLQFVWAIDKAFLNIVSSRQMVVDPLITHKATVRFPNMGPFFRATFLPKKAGVEQGVGWQIFMTNRYAPYEVSPGFPLLISSAPSPEKGATEEIYPKDYWAGPVQFLFSGNGGQPGTLTLQSELQTDEWVSIGEYPVAASATVNERTTLPLGAYRAKVKNTGAAKAGFTLSIQPALTGST